MTLVASAAVPGAVLHDQQRCTFNVWASKAESVHVHLLGPNQRIVALERGERGYFGITVDDVRDGDLYRFRLNDHPRRELPDPASRSQPQGVHGPSAVVSRDFAWSDHAWPGLPLREYVIYELHVGTFTPSGTFDAVIPHLDGLRSLGITAIEIMPVAQFPGQRNWGYDGAYPYAAQSTYGGPAGLKRLVDASHRAGIAVVLDVVYNHLGPEGNYFAEYAHYFTDRYRTPWGKALNFDGPHSDEVREYFINNALQWTDEFHIDALRLDAVHAIVDASARPFLQELAQRVHSCDRAADLPVHVIAESDLGDPRIIRPPELGGHGMDAQWLDDFHHALHTLLTGERQGYYEDFGDVGLLARSFRDGFVYAGHYSRHRNRRHGAPAPDVRPDQFVVFAQNHDQIGNRVAGDRLASALGLEQLKLAAASVLLSPFVPLLFMGEEYGETAPFPYFVSHHDDVLVEAVRNGRREEFASFMWSQDPPDPQSEATFASARLDRTLRQRSENRPLEEFYRQLLTLRRTHRVLMDFDLIDAYATGRLIVVTREGDGEEAVLALNFADHAVTLEVLEVSASWRLLVDSAAAEWGGPGRQDPSLARSSTQPRLAPWSAVLLLRET